MQHDYNTIAMAAFEQQIEADYTFKNYLANPFDAPYLDACQALVNHPYDTVRPHPLLIIGPIGSGKTHLLQAIANALMGQGKRHIRYCTGESFCNALIHSIRHGETEALRMHYRNVDALIVDDVEFIIGKDRTMQELYLTIESLALRHIPVILSSSVAPAAMDHMEPHLRQIIAGSLSVTIPYPNLPIKTLFIEHKFEHAAVTVQAAAVTLLATSMQSIRALNGAIHSLLANHPSSLPISMDMVNQLLTQLIPQPQACVPANDGCAVIKPRFDCQAATIDTPLGSLPLPEWVSGSESLLDDSESNHGFLTHLLYPRFTVPWQRTNGSDPVLGNLLPIDGDSRAIFTDDEDYLQCWQEQACAAAKQSIPGNNKEAMQ